MSDGGAMTLEPLPGWVGEELCEEFPELRLWQLRVDVRPGAMSEPLRERLRHLSDKLRHANTIYRPEPETLAYRAFFRQVGLDPDQTRTPAEAAAVRCLVKGQLVAHNLVDGVLLATVTESRIAVWAADSATLRGALGLRLAVAGERFGVGRKARSVPAGQLVVADERAPVAVLFSEVEAPYAVGSATRGITLFAIQVSGLGELDVSTALELAGSRMLAG